MYKKIHTSSKRFISFFMSLIIVCGVAFSLPLTASATTSSTYSTNASACYPGSNYLGSFTFTGYNNGSNRTIYGNKMRFCIAHKPADNSYVYGMYVSCYRWDGVLMKEVFLRNEGTVDSDGYYYYVSDYFNISYGVDYHLTYSAHTLGTSEQRKVSIHAWYDVI